MKIDQNYESWNKQENLVIEGRRIDPPNPLSYSDILKFSQCYNVIVRNCYVVGGSEDAVDIVRGVNYYLHDMVLTPKGKNGVTIKGGAKNVILENLIFESHGKECDIELGMWSDYDIVKRPKTRKVKIKNCRARDGKPLIVRCWYSDKPEIINSNVKILWWPPIVSPAYFLLRKKGLLGKLKKVEPSNLVIDPRER